MSYVHSPRPWDRRPKDSPPVIEEAVWLRRRTVLKALGLGGVLAGTGIGLGGSAACQEPVAEGRETDPRTDYEPSEKWVPKWGPPGGKELWPALRNDAYEVIRSLTPEDKAAVHNNFYEFLPGRAGPVHKYIGKFEARPWEIRIAGEVEEEKTLDLDAIPKIAPLEERLYHFRCVEAWSMVVPWTGIPLAKLVAWCKPKAAAKYVRFVGFERPEQAPGQKQADYYPWPYYEGLRMDEARNPLALLVTGIFGHALPTQHGAPARVIVPWKYGYKSAKSVTRIEFTKEQPGTFWNDVQPSEYGFLSNVEPDVPHPRWSQASERDIATGDRIQTRPYNGYAGYVADMYST